LLQGDSIVLMKFNNGRGTDTDLDLSISKDVRLVLIVAGEASADLHGSNLVKAMKTLDPSIVFWGIGGKKMERSGVKILISSSDMAVVGLTEAFSRLHTIAKASRKLKSILKRNRPDLLILIDYPDFNIHIARTAKRFHVPVLYYVSPQVWAWRKGRVSKIARRVDHMAVILPFEEPLYIERGMRVDYVGHPLLDSCPQQVDRGQVVKRLGLNEGYPVVGLLPGSRKDEIRNLLPVMVGTLEILARRYPNIQCLLPLAETIEPELIQSFIEHSAVEIKVTQVDIYEVLSVCDVALVASGTATLQTAIMGVPMVVVYRISPISYWIAKMVVKVPYISLVNLVAGEEVVPELIQHEVVPERLAQEALSLLDDRRARVGMINKLSRIKEGLGRGGASERTAAIALEMMKTSSEMR
jgi:lipid-A-disaccharide synthase